MEEGVRCQSNVLLRENAAAHMLPCFFSLLLLGQEGNRGQRVEADKLPGKKAVSLQHEDICFGGAILIGRDKVRVVLR